MRFTVTKRKGKTRRMHSSLIKNNKNNAQIHSTAATFVDMSKR
jgi:hypothetical protein